MAFSLINRAFYDAIVDFERSESAQEYYYQVMDTPIEKDGRRETLPCGCVYYAVGMRSEDSLYEELASLGIRISAVGDCKKTGKVAGAVHSGYFAAMDIGRF